jgi:phospho-N-acetylmuramoyl-pentapeptide-transferase
MYGPNNLMQQEVIELHFVYTAITPVVVAMLAYPPYIRLMQRLSWGQEIRPEGPQDHMSKRGTPTMGGAVLLCSFLVALLWSGLPSPTLLVFVMFVAAHAVLGFFDDWTQVKKKRSLGLKARQKLAVQVLLGAALACFASTAPGQHARVWLPWIGWVDNVWFVYSFIIFITTGFSNAVNLTDGLDGLAGGTVALAALAYVPICLLQGQVQLALACVALIGACAGFLWFNCFPARIFMGDTGSLALGSALGALAVLTHTEMLLVLIGGVFVMEASSVMIQVAYFKMTGGKRVFLMSPIHHHFCKKGLHEVQVTTRLWIMGFVLALLGVCAYLAGCFGSTGGPDSWRLG